MGHPNGTASLRPDPCPVWKLSPSLLQRLDEGPSPPRENASAQASGLRPGPPGSVN